MCRLRLPLASRVHCCEPACAGLLVAGRSGRLAVASGQCPPAGLATEMKALDMPYSKAVEPQFDIRCILAAFVTFDGLRIRNVQSVRLYSIYHTPQERSWYMGDVGGDELAACSPLSRFETHERSGAQQRARGSRQSNGLCPSGSAFTSDGPTVTPALQVTEYVSQ